MLVSVYSVSNLIEDHEIKIQEEVFINVHVAQPGLKSECCYGLFQDESFDICVKCPYLLKVTISQMKPHN